MHTNKGIYWVKDRKQWRLQITRNGIRYFGGLYDDLLEAVNHKKIFTDRLPPKKSQKDFIQSSRVSNARKYKEEFCKSCGNKNDLYLHHVLPISWGGDLSKENCITLCKECHHNIHIKLRKTLTLELRHKLLATHSEEIIRLVECD